MFMNFCLCWLPTIFKLIVYIWGAQHVDYNRPVENKKSIYILKIREKSK